MWIPIWEQNLIVVDFVICHLQLPESLLDTFGTNIQGEDILHLQLKLMILKQTTKY